jgi:hypothetical protein
MPRLEPTVDTVEHLVIEGLVLECKCRCVVTTLKLSEREA